MFCFQNQATTLLVTPISNEALLLEPELRDNPTLGRKVVFMISTSNPLERLKLIRTSKPRHTSILKKELKTLTPKDAEMKMAMLSLNRGTSTLQGLRKVSSVRTPHFQGLSHMWKAMTGEPLEKLQFKSEHITWQKFKRSHFRVKRKE